MRAPPKDWIIRYNLKEATFLALKEFLSLLQCRTSNVGFETILLGGIELTDK
jgi:hypothetical protein